MYIRAGAESEAGLRRDSKVSSESVGIGNSGADAPAQRQSNQLRPASNPLKALARRSRVSEVSDEPLFSQGLVASDS